MKRKRKLGRLFAHKSLQRGSGLTALVVEREFRKYLENQGETRYQFTRKEKLVFKKLAERLKKWRKSGVTISLVEYFNAHKKMADKQELPFYTSSLMYKDSYKVMFGNGSVNPEVIDEVVIGTSSLKKYQELLDYLTEVRQETEAEVLTNVPDLFSEEFLEHKSV